MINRINFDIISDIREKTNIVEVISSYIKLTRKGNNYVGLCPFHPDTTPSLVVSPKKQIFKCFVCNAKGNVFSFVQQYLKISFLEAVHTVAKLINYDDSKLRFAAIDSTFDPKIRRLIDLNNQANKWYQGFLFNPENQKQLDYLRDRKLDEAVIERFGFGYATNGNLIYKMATNHQQMFGATRDPSLV
jgi:DNA primase